MSIRTRVKAFRDALAGQTSDVLRIQLTTEEAVALVAETPEASERATAAALSLADLMAAGPAPGLDGQIAHAQAAGVLASALWDSVEGMDVDGVTVIRKRNA